MKRPDHVKVNFRRHRTGGRSVTVDCTVCGAFMLLQRPGFRQASEDSIDAAITAFGKAHDATCKPAEVTP